MKTGKITAKLRDAVPAHEETALATIPEAPVFAAPIKTKEDMPEAETTEETATKENAEPARK